MGQLSHQNRCCTASVSHKRQQPSLFSAALILVALYTYSLGGAHACNCQEDFSCVVDVSDPETLQEAVSQRCLSIKIVQHLDLGNTVINFPSGLESMIIWGSCNRTRPETEEILRASPNLLGGTAGYPCSIYSAGGSANSTFLVPTVRFMYVSNLVLHSTPENSAERTAYGIHIMDGELWMVNCIMGGFQMASVYAENTDVYLYNSASYQVGDIKSGIPEAGLNFVVTSDSKRKLVLSDTVFHADNLAGYSPVYVGASSEIPVAGAASSAAAKAAFFRQMPLIAITGKSVFFNALEDFDGDGCLGLCVGYRGGSLPLVYMDTINAAGTPVTGSQKVITPTAEQVTGDGFPLQDFGDLTWDMVKSDANGDVWLDRVFQLGVPGSELTIVNPATIPIAVAKKEESWKNLYTFIIVAIVLVLLVLVCCIGIIMYRRGRQAATTQADEESLAKARVYLTNSHMRHNAASGQWSDGSPGPHSKVYVPSGPYDGKMNEQYQTGTAPFNSPGYDSQIRQSQGLPPYEKGSYESSHSGSGSAPAPLRVSQYGQVYTRSTENTTTGMTMTQFEAQNTQGGPPARYQDLLTENMPATGKRNYRAELDLLEAQLDAVGERQGGVLLKRYLLLGKGERRAGGQGLVQFADMVYNKKRKVAIKFFLSRHAFDVEQGHYANPALQRVLPPVDDVCGNEDGACRDPYGRPFPPLVVVEKGESLDEWARRMQQADFASRMHIIIHLVERVKMLHDCGLVHRDLKPSNTIYLTSRNEWSLIDFGSAAPIGAVCSLSMSINYAAPEVVNAFASSTLPNGSRTMEVLPAVDVWSLGVMAFELLTHTRVFHGSSDTSEISSVMRGEGLLPWEDTSPEGVALNRKLGFMGNEIRGMLKRNPAERKTLREVYASWRHMLQNETVTAIPGDGF